MWALAANATQSSASTIGDIFNAATGQRRTIQLLFLNGGGFFTCADDRGESCYGVATPVGG